MSGLRLLAGLYWRGDFFLDNKVRQYILHTDKTATGIWIYLSCPNNISVQSWHHSCLDGPRQNILGK